MIQFVDKNGVTVQLNAKIRTTDNSASTNKAEDIVWEMLNKLPVAEFKILPTRS